MITYEAICEKLGFDPITDDVELGHAEHEDDSIESPFNKLSDEELEIFTDHLIANREKLARYVVR